MAPASLPCGWCAAPAVPTSLPNGSHMALVWLLHWSCVAPVSLPCVALAWLPCGSRIPLRPVTSPRASLLWRRCWAPRNNSWGGTLTLAALLKSVSHPWATAPPCIHGAGFPKLFFLGTLRCQTLSKTWPRSTMSWARATKTPRRMKRASQSRSFCAHCEAKH